MITSASQVQVTGSLGGEHVEMGFDQNSLAHLQSVLINMYSDPELAVIREYACNGRDATVEAGSDRAIEVVTPTPLSPFLKIRDFGVGLSSEDIHSIYSQYGASTKRATNDQTGCLGIGSKSGLAYASQFTVSSVKDGNRVEVAVSLGEDGAGEMRIITEFETDEPTGTEIVIPAKRHNTIAQKARDLFALWPEGSVVLDDVPAKPVHGLVLSERPATVRVTVNEDQTRDVRIERMVLVSGHGPSKLVMGGVPYPIPDEHNKLDLPWGHYLVAWVGMGEIAFAPNRESMRITPGTRQAIQAVTDHFDYAMVKAVQKTINDCTNAGEALRTLIKWHPIIPQRLRSQAKFTFKGTDMPERFSLPDEATMRVLAQRPHKLSASSRHNSVNAETASNAVWFYGYDKPTFTPTQRKKIDMYIKSLHKNWPYSEYDTDEVVPEHIILVKDKPDMAFLDPARVKDWDVCVEPLKIPRNYTGGGSRGPSGRIPGSYDMYVDGEWFVGRPADEIDTSYPVYWCDKNTEGSYVSILNHFEPGCTLVTLGANRIEKFLRNFPDAVKAPVRFREISGDWFDNLTDEEKSLIAVSERINDEKYDKLAQFRPFADPEVEAAYALYDKTQTDEVANLVRSKRVLRHPGPFETEFADPLTSARYPLAFNYGDRLPFNAPIEHVAAYINAIGESLDSDESN